MFLKSIDREGNSEYESRTEDIDICTIILNIWKNKDK